MYNLGEQFTFDYSKAIANKENIIQGISIVLQS